MRESSDFAFALSLLGPIEGRVQELIEQSIAIKGLIVLGLPIVERGL